MWVGIGNACIWLIFSLYTESTDKSMQSIKSKYKNYGLIYYVQ